MSRKQKLHELSTKEDIRYRGPLSYQGFQWLGWLCFSMAAAILLLKVGARVSPVIAEKTAWVLQALKWINTLSLPFLLIANFAKILNHSDGYKALLLKHGGAAAGILLASLLLGGRYIIGTVSQFVSDPENVAPQISTFLRAYATQGFVAYNIFIDLFLCTLFMFFLTARPKKVFTGKKLIIFRLFAILPVAYEICSMILKGQAATGRIVLPLWTYPLLTVKPVMTFVVFIVLAIFIKNREMHFRKHGRTHEEYLAFLKTNRNSLHFSVFLSVTMVVAAIVDLMIITGMTALAAPNLEMLKDIENVKRYLAVGMAMGFGGSIALAFAAPFVMLFSYTRIPKNKLISILIPIIAIVLMLLILLEGGYQGASVYARHTQKMTLQELIDMIRSAGGF